MAEETQNADPKTMLQELDQPPYSEKNINENM